MRSFARSLTLATAMVLSFFGLTQTAHAGFGGQPATFNESPYFFLGTTLGTDGKDWRATASGTCTHAYPQNDWYAQNRLVFPGFAFGASVPSNCNRVVLYPGAFQEGAGAVNCYRSQGQCTGGEYRSISWHNR